MRALDIPGAAVATIVRGEAVLCQGFGTLEADASAPVQVDTVFPIGSITKSFTALALSLLEHEHKLDWERPVRSLLEDFQLHDPVATQLVTVRDLLCHRAGLAPHDLFWYRSTLSRREMLRRLRHLAPATSFRAEYLYQNLSYMIAGAVLEAVAKQTWESFIHERILAPLEMTQTTTRPQEQWRSEPRRRYGRRTAGSRSARTDQLPSAMAPAGGLYSCLSDMTRYLQFLLDDGRSRGRQVVPKRVLARIFRAQMPIPEAACLPWLTDSFSAAGFNVSFYRGHKLLDHGGSLPGYSGVLAFMPEERSGIVVLANSCSRTTFLPELLVCEFFDRVLSLPDIDWMERFRSAWDAAGANTSAVPRSVHARAVAPPSRSLLDFCGLYAHPAYGDTWVALRRGRLIWRIHGESYHLAHLHFDVFALQGGEDSLIHGRVLQFFYDRDGWIRRLAVSLEPAVPDIEFVRRYSAALRDDERAAKLLGDYEIGSMTLSIARRDDASLVLRSPDEADRTLLPIRDDTFRVEGYEQVFIEFRDEEKDGDTVSCMFVHRPDGILSATKRQERRCDLRL